MLLDGIKKKAHNSKHVMGRMLIISATLHFVAAMLITVTAVPVLSTPELVNLSMVTVDDTWSNPAVDPNPSPVVKSISYPQIRRLTAAPRLELHQHKYQWEDDIGQLINPSIETTQYGFMKEKSDYAFIFDNFKSELASKNKTENIIKPILEYPEPGIRLSGGLHARPILNSTELDSKLNEISDVLLEPVTMMIGVDNDGNVRHILPEGQNYNESSLSAAAKLALNIHFKPNRLGIGIMWGCIEINPKSPVEPKPAEKPDTETNTQI